MPLLALLATLTQDLEPARTHAVIAGVLKWEGGALTPFSDRHRKDQELHDALVARGVPRENLALLLDGKATLAAIRTALEEAAGKAGPGSLLIFYYAGHGMRLPDGETTFANYDHAPDRADRPALALSEVARIIAKRFKGAGVLLLADCCHSGGLARTAASLSAAKIPAASLASADASSLSTGNWTFSQAVLDALRGDPLADADGDGAVTLEELAGEVSRAMKFREGQKSGFSLQGLPGRFKLADRTSPPPPAAAGDFALKDYVRAREGKKERVARVVGREEDRYVVEFFEYSDKRRATLPAGALRKIAYASRAAGETVQVEWSGRAYEAKVLKVEDDFHWVTYPGWPGEYDEWVLSTRFAAAPAKAEPTAMVEWGGRWWPALVLKSEGEKHFIRYAGYDSSWDEWVTKDRIRLPEKR